MRSESGNAPDGRPPRLHPGRACGDGKPSRRDRYDCCGAVVCGALGSLGFATEVIGLTPDLAELDASAARRPLVVFNLVDAVNGDGRLAPMVPARLEALGCLNYTGAARAPG